jgi:hypothetical protein
MSNHKIFYKYKLKHQNLGKTLPLLESCPQEQSTKKTSTETSTKKHEHQSQNRTKQNSETERGGER